MPFTNQMKTLVLSKTQISWEVISNRKWQPLGRNAIKSAKKPRNALPGPGLSQKLLWWVGCMCHMENAFWSGHHCTDLAWSVARKERHWANWWATQGQYSAKQGSVARISNRKWLTLGNNVIICAFTTWGNAMHGLGLNQKILWWGVNMCHTEHAFLSGPQCQHLAWSVAGEELQLRSAETRWCRVVRRKRIKSNAWICLSRWTFAKRHAEHAQKPQPKPQQKNAQMICQLVKPHTAPLCSSRCLDAERHVAHVNSKAKWKEVNRQMRKVKNPLELTKNYSFTLYEKFMFVPRWKKLTMSMTLVHFCFEGF